MVCPKCQTPNPEGAKFCAKCGEKLSPPSAPAKQKPPEASASGLSQNVAGALCYLFGFITGIIFLLLEKENKFIRFHAIQSILTFAGLFVLNIALGYIPFLGWIVRVTLSPLISLLSLILWILLMIKAYQGQMYKLPYIGNLAEKQVG